jgi:competence protein ComEA
LAWLGPGRLVVSALSVVVVVAGAAWLVRAPTPATEAGLPFVRGSTMPTLPAPATVPDTRPVVAMDVFFVHVAGAVAEPGVYELRPGDRVHTAIAAAGGPMPDADLDGLNLALALADGQRVYVPVDGEVDPGAVPSGGAAGADPADGPVPGVPLDLNVATAAELELLPGIGPATAAAIVDDRERHGPFATIDDLQRVPGIGPAKLAAVVDLISVRP